MWRYAIYNYLFLFERIYIFYNVRATPMEEIEKWTIKKVVNINNSVKENMH